MSDSRDDCPIDVGSLTRRRFLQAAGVTVTTVLLTSCDDPDEKIEAEIAQYERTKVAKITGLKTDVPVSFRYPFDDPHSQAFIVKLGTEAGGGIGADKDIVAFSSLCTHMGWGLSDTRITYRKEHKMLGPCPLHLTTFDLTRYGMVVAGHATEALPQIVLEVDGDDIIATGVLGLIYGKRDNLDFPGGSVG